MWIEAAVAAALNLRATPERVYVKGSKVIPQSPASRRGQLAERQASLTDPMPVMAGSAAAANTV